jgi:hypothetical protein
MVPLALPFIHETDRDAPPDLVDPFATASSGIPTPAKHSQVKNSKHPTVPILDVVRRLSTRFGSMATSEAESQCTQVAALNQLHSKLLGVVMRVSAYPVALVIVNILHTGES